jgi:hypothetical protein
MADVLNGVGGYPRSAMASCVDHVGSKPLVEFALGVRRLWAEYPGHGHQKHVLWSLTAKAFEAVRIDKAATRHHHGLGGRPSKKHRLDVMLNAVHVCAQIWNGGDLMGLNAVRVHTSIAALIAINELNPVSCFFLKRLASFVRFRLWQGHGRDGSVHRNVF